MPSDDELPSVEDIFTNHEEIVEAYGLDHPGVRAYFPERKLQNHLTDVREYNDEFKRAAKIIRSMPGLHIFEDGNKRTSWLTAIEYLDRHNLEPARTGDMANKVMRRRKRFSVEELAQWLETGEIDECRLK